jgi:hypothetical protein
MKKKKEIISVNIIHDIAEILLKVALNTKNQIIHHDKL